MRGMVISVVVDGLSEKVAMEGMVIAVVVDVEDMVVDAIELMEASKHSQTYLKFIC